MDDVEFGAVGGVNGRGNGCTRRKPTWMPRGVEPGPVLWQVRDSTLAAVHPWNAYCPLIATTDNGFEAYHNKQ
jgi:hypothetical protein